MTTPNQPYPEPVAGLMRLGDVRGELAWRNYLALGLTDQHVPDLCRMILDQDLFWADSESDEVWSAVHAWRALAQLQDERALPALLELLGRVDEYNDDWTQQELPVVFGYFGQAAIEPLRTFLADTGQGQWSRVAAGACLVKIGGQHPHLRADCVAVLSEQLEQYAHQNPNLNALLIGNLIDLQGVEAAPVIEQAFAAERVELQVQGDWEEVQIYLGLLDKRTTPPPDYRVLMTAQTGIDTVALLDSFKKKLQAPPEFQAKAKRKAQRQAADEAKAKAKAKRKQARQSRKKQRKRK